MSLLYRTILRPAVFLQDSEKAHNRLISTLARTSRSRLLTSLLGNLYSSPELPINLFGLDFPNPLGIAAGMDKNGAAVPSWQSIGYGFSEIGGVTLHDQLGNPKPRMFRATAEKALVNRMGFNNIGANAVNDSLKDWKKRGLWPDSPVGINLGKSKITKLNDAPKDYSKSLEILWKHADFFVINVSSPNTLGLRELQQSEHLESILNQCQKTNNTSSKKEGKDPKPLLVKIAPELDDDYLKDIIKLIEKYNLSGIIATNTTIQRPETKNNNCKKVYSEEGGLSGIPLRDISTEMIRKIYKMTDGKVPIIGVGGIFTAEDAWDKIAAGASLIQLYTGLVFEGPGIARNIVSGLKKRVASEGFESISDAIGIDA
ncbi:MAG: quinone-dependent dihydroorotate dehydrogenase [Candidatus Poseidoniia archaeon]|uniref:Dihydroorotate dehydrogenase (quinone) n=1 Tax=Marine Group III euryarchaeote TaxID=2173149 RepID=A0A7J4GRN0_9ARCH|nr:quinone-dependent dihydroorotate dehydrogenase [Marine Group III euryarchaeote]